MRLSDVARDLERLVGDDERTHELGVRIEVHGDRLVVEGEVASASRRRLVLDVLAEQVGDREIVDHLTLSAEPSPGSPAHEEITPRSAE
ncbi:MAG: hypothetical protein J2O46_01285 [Nocardioides sp.]|nr:hypothetical protein [Nocardioides sp.]